MNTEDICGLKVLSNEVCNGDVQNSANKRCPGLDEGCMIGKMDYKTPCLDSGWRECYEVKYGKRREQKDE